MDRRVTTQAGLLVASRTAGQILNAVVTFIIVRKFSQVEYGTLRQVYLLATTLTMTEMCFSESLYFFIPAFPQYRGVFVRQTLAVVAVSQVITGTLIYVFRQPIAIFLRNQFLASCLGLIALYSGFAIINRIWEVWLVAERRMLLAAVTGRDGTGFEAFKVLLLILALIAASGIRPLLWALMIAAAFKCVGSVLYLGREFRWFFDAGPIRQGAPQFAYAMALWIPSLLYWGIGSQGPQYIVAHYFGPSQYAIYAVACFQIPFTAIVSNTISEVMLVRATEYHHQGKHRDLYDLWINGCRKALLIYVGIVAALVSFAKPMITVLFTHRYQSSAQLFAVMSLGLVFSAIFQDNIFRACSAMRTYAFFYALRAVLSVALAYAGLRLWGLLGVALATVVSLAIVNILQLLPSAKLLQVPFSRVLPWLDMMKLLLVGLVAAFVSRLSLHIINSPAAQLVTGLSVFSVIYVASVIKLGLLNRTELSVILEEVKRRVGWAFRPAQRSDGVPRSFRLPS